MSALLWGGAWSVVYVVTELVARLGTGHVGAGVPHLLRIALGAGASGATWGLIAGASFGVVFSWTQRGRRLTQISPGKAALWGAVGGTIVPSIELANALLRAAGPISFRWGAAALLPVLGALSAATAVHLANRARAVTDPPGPPQALGAGDTWSSTWSGRAGEQHPAAERRAT